MVAREFGAFQGVVKWFLECSGWLLGICLLVSREFQVDRQGVVW